MTETYLKPLVIGAHERERVIIRDMKRALWAVEDGDIELARAIMHDSLRNHEDLAGLEVGHA